MGIVILGIESSCDDTSAALGSDYFVIPSSIHEVLILPDNGIFQVPELNAQE